MEARTLGTLTCVSTPDLLSRWREVALWTGTARSLVIHFEHAVVGWARSLPSDSGQPSDSQRLASGRLYWRLEAARQIAVVAVDWTANAARQVGLHRPSSLDQLDIIRNILEHRDEYLDAWADRSNPRPFDPKSERSGHTFTQRHSGQSPFIGSALRGTTVNLTAEITTQMVLDWLEIVARDVQTYSEHLATLMPEAPARPSLPIQ